ncbi:GNAT family N-acetyltransferase [Longispora sp. NPDC051575]|uniref:GNAT family N-acetyltransferase n=1 Tax=Longispora sp. NPDC051575 TaxID=3154943 RepID=UPI00342200EC
MRLRPYNAPGDLAAVEAVRAAVLAAEGDVWLPGPGDDDVADNLPHCVLAELDGRVVGYAWTQWWTEADGTRLYLLTGAVAPDSRGRGVGRALLARQEARAAELAAAEGAARPVLGGNADESQPGTRALLLAAGFEIAFTKVHLEAATGRYDAALPTGFDLRPVTPDQHPVLHAAIEACFVDSPNGYVERTFEEYLEEVAEEQSDLDLWLAAWDGDELAGVVVNTIGADGTGGTPWVAVLPRWRRRGLARALMYRSLDLLAARGVTRTALHTVLENENDSVGLYESVGYEVVARRPRYRKPLAA